jgi:DinB superfamily
MSPIAEPGNENIEYLRYPLGRYKAPEEFSDSKIINWVSNIESFPAKLKSEVDNLNDSQLNTSYREDGWTVKQVVHHLADSHLNAYIRVKLTLTEDEPTVKPYFEYKWAKLIDSEIVPIGESLKLLRGVHQRWAAILKNLSEEEWQRRYFHPENKSYVSLKEMTALYSWHCDHHLAHITSLKQRMGWK